MCLLFVDLKRFENIPLIITFNRDESHDRPTSPAHFWQDTPEILAGRDLLKGGTWGGITTGGRLAFLTFVRRKEPRMESPWPRGEIVPKFLRGQMSPEDYLKELHETRHKYLGYNLICGDRNQLWHYSNAEGKISSLSAGVHGVSNALLNTPWKKVTWGKEKIASLTEPQVVDGESLFRIAMDGKRVDAEDVPKDTGMSFEKEWYRSSIFVQAPGYGTRSSSVILFFADGSIEFNERTHYPNSGTKSFRIE